MWKLRNNKEKPQASWPPAKAVLYKERQYVKNQQVLGLVRTPISEWLYLR